MSIIMFPKSSIHTDGDGRTRRGKGADFRLKVAKHLELGLHLSGNFNVKYVAVAFNVYPL